MVQDITILPKVASVKMQQVASSEVSLDVPVEAEPKQALADALTTIEDDVEMLRFLIDLCTPSELRALSERWHVAKLLDRGDLSYREINRLTGVSTTTIGRVARFLNEEPHQGYRAVLDRQKGH